MGDDISDQKRREYKSMFDFFDKGNDGRIDSHELGTVVRGLGHNPTMREVQQMIKEGDTNGSGYIEFNEFCKMMARKEREMAADQEDELKKAFKVFDKDGNGFISAQELRHVMTTLGEKLTEKEVDEMVSSADKNGDGVINYNEYCGLMCLKKPPKSTGQYRH